MKKMTDFSLYFWVLSSIFSPASLENEVTLCTRDSFSLILLIVCYFYTYYQYFTILPRTCKLYTSCLSYYVKDSFFCFVFVCKFSLTKYFGVMHIWPPIVKFASLLLKSEYVNFIVKFTYSCHNLTLSDTWFTSFFYWWCLSYPYNK